jgi:hypothetical protein
LLWRSHQVGVSDWIPVVQADHLLDEVDSNNLGLNEPGFNVIIINQGNFGDLYKKNLATNGNFLGNLF